MFDLKSFTIPVYNLLSDSLEKELLLKLLRSGTVPLYQILMFWKDNHSDPAVRAEADTQYQALDALLNP